MEQEGIGPRIGIQAKNFGSGGKAARSKSPEIIKILLGLVCFLSVLLMVQSKYFWRLDL